MISHIPQQYGQHHNTPAFCGKIIKHLHHESGYPDCPNCLNALNIIHMVTNINPWETT